MAQTLEHNKEVTTVVPVTIPAFDDDLNIIQKLDDEPNDVGGLTAAELKAKFDEGNLSAQQYINNVLIPTVIADDLSEQARQAAEAERVANEIDRVTNEQAREKAEKERVNETSGVVALATAQAEAAAESARKATQAALGQIVDGSLEPAKFSGESRSMMVRENLLDNWYLGNPVNQRGQMSYTGTGYGIDRWHGSSLASITLESDGVLFIKRENGTPVINTLLEKERFVNGYYTISICYYVDNKLEISKDTFYLTVGDTIDTNSINVGSSWYANFYAGSQDVSNGIYKLRFYNPSGAIGDSCKLIAVKLELGSQQTLAHQDANGNWVLNEIPDYGEQLARCQRYFWRSWTGERNNQNSILGVVFGNNHRITGFDYPVEMRTKPSITVYGLTGAGKVTDWVSDADYGTASPAYWDTQRCIALACDEAGLSNDNRVYYFIEANAEL